MLRKLPNIILFLFIMLLLFVSCSSEESSVDPYGSNDDIFIKFPLPEPAPGDKPLLASELDNPRWEDKAYFEACTAHVGFAVGIVSPSTNHEDDTGYRVFVITSLNNFQRWHIVGKSDTTYHFWMSAYDMGYTDFCQTLKVQSYLTEWFTGHAPVVYIGTEVRKCAGSCNLSQVFAYKEVFDMEVGKSEVVKVLQVKAEETAYVWYEVHNAHPTMPARISLRGVPFETKTGYKAPTYDLAPGETKTFKGKKSGYLNSTNPISDGAIVPFSIEALSDIWTVNGNKSTIAYSGQKDGLDCWKGELVFDLREKHPEELVKLSLVQGPVAFGSTWLLQNVRPPYLTSDSWAVPPFVTERFVETKKRNWGMNNLTGRMVFAWPCMMCSVEFRMKEDRIYAYPDFSACDGCM